MYPEKKYDERYIDPVTKRFRKGNPGKPKGVGTSLTRRKDIVKEVIDELIKRRDIKELLNVILFDVLRCYDPVKFRKWANKNQTIFYTKIIAPFFPSRLDVTLDAETKHKLTYEFVLPQLIEAKEKGLLRSRLVNGERVLEYTQETQQEAQHTQETREEPVERI